MGQDPEARLVKLKDYLKEADAEIIGGLGLGGGIRTFYRRACILRESARALKAADAWVLKHIRPNHVVAHNRITRKDVSVPTGVLKPSLRRHAGVGFIDITEQLDFLVTDQFPGMESFLGALEPDFRQHIATWKLYVKARLGRLIVLRKFDLSAPGTKLFAFYSSDPAASGDLWGIAGLKDEDARVLAVWLNSTPNLLQMFLKRTETRGAWMKIDVSALKDSYVMNPRALTAGERKSILRTFRKVSTQRFPSLLDQLRKRFAPRSEMDRAVLRALGFRITETEEIMTSLYSGLADEIGRLKALMEAVGQKAEEAD